MFNTLIISSPLLIADPLASALEHQGFMRCYYASTDGAIHAVNQIMPELIILSMLRPQSSDAALCSAIRTYTQAPMLVLAATQTPEIVAEMLAAGADDYQKEPISPALLIALINKLTRRCH